MDYLFQQLPYLFIAAVVMTAIIIITTVIADKNAAKRSDEENRARAKACDSCQLASMCTRIGNGDSCEKDNQQ